MLYGVHVGLSHGLKVEELKLDREEAEQLAQCVQEIENAYGVQVPEKVQVWANMASVAGAIYVPRAMMFMARKELEREGAADAPTQKQSQKQQQPQPQPQPQPKRNDAQADKKKDDPEAAHLAIVSGMGGAGQPGN